MPRPLPLILAMAFGTMPNAWAAGAAELDAEKSTRAPRPAQVQSAAASAPLAAPPSKTVISKPVPQRSVPAASRDAHPFTGKAPALGLCDGS